MPESSIGKAEKKAPGSQSQYAQAFLDPHQIGLVAGGHPDVFFGLFTIHAVRGGSVVGWLSANGYSRQVLLHTWRGQLLAMTEADIH